MSTNSKITVYGAYWRSNPNGVFTFIGQTPNTGFLANSGVEPENITQIIVRAHHIVEDFGGQEVLVELTKSVGENFEVNRQD